MCLQKVDLNLMWDARQQDYVGYGYKVMHDNEIPKYKKWKMAGGNFHKVLTPSNRKERWMKNTIESSIKGKKLYHPGFHIFLNKEDARCYNTTTTLVKVMFKGVLVFGTNFTHTYWNYKRNKNVNNYAPCVVATHMKIVEVLNDNS